jgi:hypothetical protein
VHATPVGCRSNDLRVLLETNEAQQPVMINRLFATGDIEPSLIRIKVHRDLPFGITGVPSADAATVATKASQYYPLS